MHRKAAGFGLVATIAIVSLGCSRTDDRPSRIEQVEHGLQLATLIEGQAGLALADRMAHHHVPGVSLAVIDEAKVQWVRHYGVMDGSGRPVADETLFNVGSVSKAVTAATILSLAEDGLVDLDSPINDQLRSWKLPENELTGQAPVTPLRLMNHSGGVVFSPPYTYAAEDLPNLGQLLEGLPPARSAPIRVDRVPGTTFQYSNAGFEVLRLLAEDVTGWGFADIVEKRIFLPAGMHRSSISAPLPPALLADAALGHRGDGAPDATSRRWMSHIAAGGVWTTATEYASFVTQLQRALRGERGLILEPESVRLMVQPHEAPEYGLGVFQRGGGEHARYVSHLGDGPGFVAGFTMDVIGGRGVVVLTNGRGGIELVREIGRSVAAVYGWPHFLPDTITPIPLPEPLLTELEGRYRIGTDEELILELRDASLWLDSVTEGPFRLHAVDESTFVCRERAGEITVVRSDGGTIDHLMVHLGDEFGTMVDPRPAAPLAADERTPLGLLLDGRAAEATELYRQMLAADPGSTAPSEDRLNRLGYRLLGRSRNADAVAVLRLCADLYPDSANAHDSLGEALMMSGRTDDAIASYRRSLDLDPDNRNAREMVAKMGGEPHVDG